MTIEYRICKLYNELTPTYFPYLGNHDSTLIDVQLTSNQPHTFHLHYLIDKAYNNPSMLYEQLLSVTDRFLDDWFDLTQFGDDFKIYIHYVDRYNSTETFTYFELMQKSIDGLHIHSYNSYTFQTNGGRLMNNPRFEKYSNWLKSKKESEKRLDLLNKYQEIMFTKPKEPETLIGKLKNKFVDLFHV